MDILSNRQSEGFKVMGGCSYKQTHPWLCIPAGIISEVGNELIKGSACPRSLHSRMKVCIRASACLCVCVCVPVLFFSDKLEKT